MYRRSPREGCLNGCLVVIVIFGILSFIGSMTAKYEILDDKNRYEDEIYNDDNYGGSNYDTNESSYSQYDF